MSAAMPRSSGVEGNDQSVVEAIGKIREADDHGQLDQLTGGKEILDGVPRAAVHGGGAGQFPCVVQSRLLLWTEVLIVFHLEFADLGIGEPRLAAGFGMVSAAIAALIHVRNRQINHLFETMFERGGAHQGLVKAEELI